MYQQYFSCHTISGGIFGAELSLRAAGNLYTIIGFAVMPFILSIPEAVMTYELSPLYPCPSGGVRFVRMIRLMFDIHCNPIYVIAHLEAMFSYFS